MASNFNDENNETWDPYFQCFRVNGVLNPVPRTIVRPPAPPQPEPEPQPQPAPSPTQHEQPQSSTLIQKRKRRDLAASKVIDTKEFSLNLLRCEEEFSYILEKTEMADGYKTYYMLIPYEKLGKMKIEPKEISLRQRVLLPVIENEVNLIRENKYNLSLRERLEGKWIVEVRERTGTTKTEKFYFHERVNKTMRSFNDVATFVLYAVIH